VVAFSERIVTHARQNEEDQEDEGEGKVIAAYFRSLERKAPLCEDEHGYVQTRASTAIRRERSLRVVAQASLCVYLSIVVILCSP